MKNLEKYWLSKWDNIVMKVGSNILAWNSSNKEDIDFWINHKNVQNIVSSVDYLMWLWLNVFLVSSWAVAIWRRNFEKHWIIFWDILSLDEKAFLAGNWQITLMNIYYKLFEEKNILITQNLLTHSDFINKKNISNLQNVRKKNIKNRTLAIINENDPISREELKFSDNDQLAWLVAKVVNAKLLILLSDIDWLYKNYWKENQELIEEVRDIESIRVHSNKEKKVWSNWTGLMDSKLNVFAEMLKNWIIWILTNWWEQYIIKRIFEGTDCKRTVFRV